jgi:hypothetical protein
MIEKKLYVDRWTVEPSAVQTDRVIPDTDEGRMVRLLLEKVSRKN